MRELQRKRQTAELRVDVDQILDRDASKSRKNKACMAAKGGQSRNLFPTEASANYQKPFGTNLMADDDIMRAYTVNSSDLGDQEGDEADYEDDRLVREIADANVEEYGCSNANNDNVILVTNYHALVPKDGVRTPQSIPAASTAARHTQKKPESDSIFGKELTQQLGFPSGKASVNLHSLKNLNAVPVEGGIHNHTQSARNSRPGSRASVLNQELQRYFHNKKQVAAPHRITLARPKAKSKPPSQATSLLWVESLYIQLKNATASGSKGSVTPRSQSRSAKSNEDNLVITGVGYRSSGGAQTQMMTPHEANLRQVYDNCMTEPVESTLPNGSSASA